MRIVGMAFLMSAGMAVAAQQPPQQMDVLRAMRLASENFMGSWPDPERAIGEKGTQPDKTRARAICHDGLMGMYSIDPDRKYVEYARKLGVGRADVGRQRDDRQPAGGDAQPGEDGLRMAALVRRLSVMHVNDARRPGSLQDYQALIHRLTPLQDATGLWSAGGLGRLGETELIVYGMAWGIREGWLDRKGYWPIAAKAWDAIADISNHGATAMTAGELGCFLLAGTELYQIAESPAANEVESKVPPYEEPALQLSTAGAWEKERRPEIYRLFEKDVYGRMPDVKIKVIPRVVDTDTGALEGLAIRKDVTLEWLPGDTAARLHLMLYLPKHVRKAPVFVGYSFTPNDVTEHSTQWPLKEIISRGYGVAVAWYWDIEPDRESGWQTGIRTRLAAALHIEPNEWSAMGAWAWGLERIADYLQTEPGVDSKRMIAIGHSRLGKAALWAGASDRRFAMVVSNESGEGGAAMARRDYGETIAIINDQFPWWFARAYKGFGSNPAAMPVDQYELLAMIAPRPLYVASAMGDQWSDPKGEFLSAQLAGQVYRLYAETGVGVDSMPALEHPVGDFIGYHIRTGKHDLTLYDWQRYMDFADSHGYSSFRAKLAN